MPSLVASLMDPTTYACKTPGTLLAGLKQGRFERRLGATCLENPAAIVPAVNHVIERAGEFESEFAGHTSAHDRRPLLRQCRVCPNRGDPISVLAMNVTFLDLTPWDPFAARF